MKMISCYATGIFPRPRELIKITRDYARKTVNERQLENAFDDATAKIIEAQISSGFSYVADGMLKWQDPLRPLTENLGGVETGGMARWFNNNTFYRKPVVVDDLYRKKGIIESSACVKRLPKNLPWKAILAAPYTFAQLCENRFYDDKTELMFKYAETLRKEIESAVKLGFKYVQLSDPALVYEPITASRSADDLGFVHDALKVAVDGMPIKTCLQTFFGDFSNILPEALSFPVDDLGVDLYETNLEKVEGYGFEKGISLGLVNSRSSLVENPEELIVTAKEIIQSIYRRKAFDFFACPNCDLEFLPWERAEEKMQVVSVVVNGLRKDFHE
jgi:5-methyltetrahydropteroyltriglutamate--homocysteine methyltransferase